MLFLNCFGLSLWIVLLTGLVGLYLHLIKTFKYWSSRGIKGPKPLPLLGTMWQMFFNPIITINEENSKKYGNVYGLYFGSQPALCVADPDLIKQMNIRDFHLFSNRGTDLIFDDVLNDRSLFNLMDEDWKTIRSIISPTFSSGKMRSMHPIITDCVQRLEKYLENKCMNRGVNEMELKKVMGSLTMDVIASCAFGTKIDTYDEEKKSEFLISAEKLFGESWRFFVYLMFYKRFSKLLKWLGIEAINPMAAKFFKSAIQSMITSRKTSKGKHRDYLQLMINAQNRAFGSDEQEIEVDDKEEIFGQMDETEHLKSNKSKGKITEDDMLANSVTFLVAGYDTTASLITSLFYSLALNEKCQQKLFEEVISYNGNYEYESIAKMHYLEACVAETLRLYTPFSMTGRTAAEDYTIDKIGITIPKGMSVSFDIQSLHRNPEYYPSPEVWNPERFMPENRDQLTPYTYMPFGIGPRNCVGMRFALMEAKTAIAHLVYKFKFFKTSNTCLNLKYKKFDFILNTGPIIVGFELRTK